VLRISAEYEKRQSRKGLAFFLRARPARLLAVLALGMAAAGCGRAEPGLSTADCSAGPGLERAEVAYVVDGDTLHLSNGDKVRLIGINTPEMGRDGRAPQPLARAATDALRELVGGGTVLLQDGVDPRDRYGRRLAHVFTADGANVEAQMLRRGLAFHVAVTPNFAHLECLQLAQTVAREAGRGVWREAAYQSLPASRLGRKQAGFTRVHGRVTSVTFKDNGWWLQLDGKIGLRIEEESQYLFDRYQLSSLRGQRVEASGWLIAMGSWWQMKIPHPVMLEAD
jgi:endonuclease YncB( thermonuclease family)